MLAVAFSAGLVLGVFGALDLAWDGAAAKSTGVANAVPASDLAWDTAPKRAAGA
ncbi:hypothetical protein OG338_13615 [Streptomyces sp. NBC_00726]|uniref:hypothetical protein n=1 Tax=Streptomyces sp. NBC_00726 TaxID=2903674 RepID=UPI00386D5938